MDTHLPRYEDRRLAARPPSLAPPATIVEDGVAVPHRTVPLRTVIEAERRNPSAVRVERPAIGLDDIRAAVDRRDDAASLLRAYAGAPRALLARLDELAPEAEGRRDLALRGAFHASLGTLATAGWAVYGGVRGGRMIGESFRGADVEGAGRIIGGGVVGAGSVAAFVVSLNMAATTARASVLEAYRAAASAKLIRDSRALLHAERAERASSV